MKKRILTLIGVLLFFGFLTAEEKENSIPEFLGVSVGDSTLSAIDKLTKLGYDMLVLDDTNVIFGNEYSSVKFGDNVVPAVGLTSIDGRVLGIGLMFESKRLSSIDYRKAVQDYINQFSDVVVIQQDKMSDTGEYFYSMWFVADKYMFYSQEKSGNSTVFSVYDKEGLLEYGIDLGLLN